MKPKKNPNADLRKNIPLFFAAALYFVVFVTWRVIEFRTYESKYDYEALNVEIDDDEMIPITEQLKTPPPPPPPPAPEIIEVVEDEEEVEETVIESTETTQEEIIEEVEVLEEEVDVDGPFAIIEDVPLFPGCERVKKSQRRKCFQEKMARHISINFRYPEFAKRIGIEGRVYVQFIIDNSNLGKFYKSEIKKIQDKNKTTIINKEQLIKKKETEFNNQKNILIILSKIIQIQITQLTQSIN